MAKVKAIQISPKVKEYRRAWRLFHLRLINKNELDELLKKIEK